MPENYLEQLLALTPRDGAFAAGSLPVGQILAQRTRSGDAAVEEAMRSLARRVPFTLGAWPSFTSDVNDHYRVRVQNRKIDVVFMERGLGSGAVGLDFLEAFHQVLRLLTPRHSAEAKPIADSLDGESRRRIGPWLVKASLIKHMYEANDYFGHQAAAPGLTWMCEELVRIGASANMREAVQSEATLVHALQLGGIPKQFARGIYRGFMPSGVQDAIV